MAIDRTAQYAAYNMASQTVAKTRQIVMLYEGAIRFMKQAEQAIVEKRIEDRYHLLMRASDVIMGLQGALDFDEGGEVAQTLYDYYSSLDSRILTIHRSQSIEMCESVINDLKLMRDSWDFIDTGEVAGDRPQPNKTQATAPAEAKGTAQPSSEKAGKGSDSTVHVSA